MSEDFLLRAERVHKRYGGVHALRGVSLHIRPGEIHGLIGENGSGKSTLLGTLSGQVSPDDGVVSVNGAKLRFGDPVCALNAGIATVTQETTLVPDLSVAENILLGRRSIRRWRGLDWRATRAKAALVLDRLELEIDPRALVGSLRPDEQQMTEIARAISMEARIVILDEPTSSLTDEEVEALFKMVRGLRDHGVSTIFVSHRMQEVMSLTDRLTVLRDGKTIAERETAEIDGDGLIELMVGRALAEQTPLDGSANGNGSREGIPARLCLQGLSMPDVVHDVNLDVGPGEVLGLAGLVGAGRSELLRAAFGLHHAVGGQVVLDGEVVPRHTPTRAIESGLAYVPADRKLQGLVLDMTTRENLMMASTARMLRLSRPPRRREARELELAIDSFSVRGVIPGNPISSLSGGNQQKVVLAKWLLTKPKALLLDEPTRGVDVGAKREIYRLLDEARSSGLAVIVSSSEIPELLLLCDRIAVMVRGRVVALIDRSEASETLITEHATGHG